MVFVVDFWYGNLVQICVGFCAPKEIQRDQQQEGKPKQGIEEKGKQLLDETFSINREKPLVVSSDLFDSPSSKKT